MDRVPFALLGAIGAGSLVWAMCAVFVERDPTQIVAAVGLLAISGIAGTAIFVIRLSRVAPISVGARSDEAVASPPKLAVLYAPD